MVKHDLILEFLRQYNCPTSPPQFDDIAMCSICHHRTHVSQIRFKHLEKGNEMVLHLCPDCFEMALDNQTLIPHTENSHEKAP